MRDEVVAIGDRRVGQARLHRLVGQAALEEARAGLRAACRASSRGKRASSKRFTHLETQDLAEMPQSVASTEIRRDDLVLGVVVLELLQVRRVDRRFLGIQRHGWALR